MIGKKYGRLTVQETISRNGGIILCKCECGKETIVPSRAVRSGNTSSCGCLKNEGNNYRHGAAVYKNESPEYFCWKGMKSRCSNKNNKYYKNYGGRGIFVCERWATSFSNFYSDMGPRPSINHSLDRINVNGDYSPDNCRWATKKEQNRNRRSNRRFNVDGEIMPLVAVAEKFGFRQHTIIHRMRKGKTIKEALTMPNDYGLVLRRYRALFGNVRPSSAKLPKTKDIASMTIEEVS